MQTIITLSVINFYRSSTVNRYHLIAFLDRQDLRMSLSPVSKISSFFELVNLEYEY